VLTTQLASATDPVPRKLGHNPILLFQQRSEKLIVINSNKNLNKSTKIIYRLFSNFALAFEKIS
jgi:hypothetical protein